VRVDQSGRRGSRRRPTLGGVSLIYHRLVFLQRLDAFNPAATLQLPPLSGSAVRHRAIEPLHRALHFCQLLDTSAVAVVAPSRRRADAPPPPHRIHSRQHAPSTCDVLTPDSHSPAACSMWIRRTNSIIVIAASSTIHVRF